MTQPPAKRAPLTHIAHRFIEAAVERARAGCQPDAGTGASTKADAGVNASGGTGARADAALQPTPSSAVKLLAIDATAGNGHDTLFLARLLSKGGEVAAFDIQKEALQNTAARLQADPSASNTPLASVRLIEGSHAQMPELLPASWLGNVCVITFNLGYLPGADKALATEAHSTLPALNAALRLLAPGGLLSVMCYRGHPQGELETKAIAEWLPTLPAGFTHSFTEAFTGAPAHAPILLRIEAKPLG